MNVFKDLIFDTASMMLRHLDTEKTARLLRQTKKTASAMFLKLSQIGTIILSENDVQRMFGGMSVLNSSTILEGDLFKHRKTPGPSLPGNAQRWFKPLDLIRIFRPPFTVQSKLDSSRDDGNRLPEVRRIAGKETSTYLNMSKLISCDIVPGDKLMCHYLSGTFHLLTGIGKLSNSPFEYIYLSAKVYGILPPYLLELPYILVIQKLLAFSTRVFDIAGVDSLKYLIKCGVKRHQIFPISKNWMKASHNQLVKFTLKMNCVIPSAYKFRDILSVVITK
ncbi:hypothetical protein EGR_03955 [Echinococcus granulosus]|uniref:Uncharacterized protein n=1 Tax=Echinococcus granulosus TaxID=6210 RepID=W6URY3_ECHGR|nr:hypothetical protein EGR_03955 [Echinococcus granulosus]EUB61107.1 hypothetical protein EGR_03955 [Echinococcus granulosus]